MSFPVFPAEVYKSLTQSHLLDLLEPYDLDRRAVSVAPLRGGLRNACFLVLSGERKYVLCLYQPGASSDRHVLEIIKLQEFLHHRGFSVPKVVPTRGGLFFFYRKLLGCPRRVALFSYLEGWTLSFYLPRHLFAAGKALSDLHAALKSYPRKRFLPGLGSAETVLHLDFARANLLFANRRLCGILDFELAAAGEAVLDIARSLSLFFLDHPRVARSRIRNFFLKGYAVGGNVLPNLGVLLRLEEECLAGLVKESPVGPVKVSGQKENYRFKKT